MGFLSSDSEHPGPFLTLRTPNTPLAFLSLADRLSLLSALGIFSPTLSSDWDGVPRPSAFSGWGKRIGFQEKLRPLDELPRPAPDTLMGEQRRTLGTQPHPPSGCSSDPHPSGPSAGGATQLPSVHGSGWEEGCFLKGNRVEQEGRQNLSKWKTRKSSGAGLTGLKPEGWAGVRPC